MYQSHVCPYAQINTIITYFVPRTIRNWNLFALYVCTFTLFIYLYHPLKATFGHACKVAIVAILCLHSILNIKKFVGSFSCA